MFVFAGMLAMMALAGLPTSTSMLMTALSYGNFGNITASTLFTAIVALLGLGATVAYIIVGLFTRQSTESGIVASLSTTLLFIFISDMASIYNYFNGICGAGSDCYFISRIVMWIMIVMAGAFFVSIVQWWRGNDI